MILVNYAQPKINAVPVMPPHYIMNFIQYEVFDPKVYPPYSGNGLPPVKEYNVSYGQTYYDWSKFAMIENYTYCVPIFTQGNRWPCEFLNVNNISYLLSWGSSPFPPCCIFEQPWRPVGPRFLDKLSYNKTTILQGKSVDWWVLGADNPMNVFGYGIYPDVVNNTYYQPAVFYFAGLYNISNALTEGWCSQQFVDFQFVVPPEDVWNVPEDCVNAVKCNWP